MRAFLLAVLHVSALLPATGTSIIDLFINKYPRVKRVRNVGDLKSVNGDVPILDFIGLVERHGYPAEEHNLTTSDGYHLTFQRIPGSPMANMTNGKPVVLLQQGILSTSDQWVLQGPGRDLAFLLADSGYDVWLANYRGNSYCRSHVQLSTLDRDFWQFSYHDIGLIDTRSIIDYVLDFTKQKDLCYVGHSMGTTVIYVLLSTLPEYNQKVKLVVSLAPVASWKYLQDPLARNLAKNAPMIRTVLDKYEVYDVLPLNSLLIKSARILCSDAAITQVACVTLYFRFAGIDVLQLNTSMLSHLFTYYPAGTSIQTVHHYLQNIQSGRFEAFDYGHAENLIRYNQKKPPKYDLKKITTAVALFYGLNDALVESRDVKELYKQLSNVVVFEAVPYKHFNHLDFMWAIDGKALLYDRIIEVIGHFYKN